MAIFCLILCCCLSGYLGANQVRRGGTTDAWVWLRKLENKWLLSFVYVLVQYCDSPPETVQYLYHTSHLLCILIILLLCPLLHHLACAPGDAKAGSQADSRRTQSVR